MSRSADRERALDEMLDRDEIWHCLLRYARGVDRLDVDLILSAYHPDAVDDHGNFSGSPVEFVEWYVPAARKAAVVHHHQLTNHLCDLDGDVAHTETYYIYAAELTRDSRRVLHGGRYVDRFERREGRWAIAARLHMAEWAGALGDLAASPSSRTAGVSARDLSDTSYLRPLGIVGHSERTDVAVDGDEGAGPG